MKFLIVLFGILAVTFAEKARFDNYRIYSFRINSTEQLDILQQVENLSDGYHFWTPPNLNRDVDIVVPPHKFGDIVELADALQLDVNIKVYNLQKLFDEELPKRQTKATFWEAYQSYDAIEAWIQTQVNEYPSLLTLHPIGTTAQGRPLNVVRLSAKSGNPAIFLEANIHAREWITSATCTHFLNELLTSTDPTTIDLAQNIDWYIICVANPDGLVFTQTTNRLWRKNRNQHSTPLCVGTDLNRNFDFHWMQGGASNNPCTETYGGPSAFSEPESKAIADFYATIANRVQIYLSFHSFGQYLLFPYGHTNDVSEDHDDLLAIGQTTIDALRSVYGTEYLVGTVSNTLYIATGSSADWAYGIHGTPLSYTYELRSIRNTPNGFVLPPDQIIPNSEEVEFSIKAMIEHARALRKI